MDRKRSIRRVGRYERPSLFKRFKECTRKFVAFLFSNVGIIGLVVSGHATCSAPSKSPRSRWATR